MTTTEHLQKIKSKCEQLIQDYAPFCQMQGDSTAYTGAHCAVAAWRSTIAAIDAVENFSFCLGGWEGIDPCPACIDNSKTHDKTIAAILAAWPEELL